MEEFYDFVSSKLGIDLNELNDLPAYLSDPDNRNKVIGYSVLGLTTTFSIGYLVKKGLDYSSNMTPPTAALAQAESLSKIFTSPSGAVIEYIEYGDPQGYPILCFPGSMMTPLEGVSLDKLAKNAQLRLIYISRPGSSPRATFPTYLTPEQRRELNGLGDLPQVYSMATYMCDVTHLLAQEFKLEAGEYGVMGASQGAVFALSGLRYLHPTCVTLVNGTPCMTREEIENSALYKKVVPAAALEQLVEYNSSSSRRLHYMNRFMARYYRSYMMQKIAGISVKNKNSDLNGNTAGGAKGAGGAGETSDGREDVWSAYGYMMGQSYKPGVAGNLWGMQMVAGNFGWKFGEMGKKEKECKVFMHVGRFDGLVDYQWSMTFYRKLVDEYQFGNVEMKVNQCGHVLGDTENMQVLSAISSYVKQLK